MGVKKRGPWKRKGSRRDERVKEKRESWCAFLCYCAKKRACAAKRTWTKERGKGAEVGSGSSSGSSSGSRPSWHWDWLVQGWIARNGDDQDKARAWQHSVFCACRWEKREEIFIYDERSESWSCPPVPTGLPSRPRNGQIKLPWPGSCRSHLYTLSAKP